MACPPPRFEDYVAIRAPSFEEFLQREAENAPLMTPAEVEVLMDKIWEHMPSRIVCKHPPPREVDPALVAWERWGRSTSSGGPR